jgi:two-component sensor histidine kinase
LAVALAAAAIALRLGFSSWLEPTRFITYFIAIGTAAFFFGWRQATMVLILSILSILAARDLSMTTQPGGLPAVGRLIATIIVCSLAGGLEILVVSGLRDLTARLSRLNKTQETLFNELQHRVANNMQMVAAMLQSTKRSVSDPVALEVIDQATARIDDLAKLHRQLYSPSTYNIGLEPVLRTILLETFRGLPVNVSIDVTATDLSIDQMTAIVLLVNEAALNAAKHVFRPAKGKLFYVSLAVLRHGVLVLTVGDDGPGIKGISKTSTQGNTLGINIMRAFARQLGGQLEVTTGTAGTTLRVEFANG